MPRLGHVSRSNASRLRLLLAAAIPFVAATLALRHPAPAAAAGTVAAGSTTAPASLLHPVTPFAVRRGGGFRSRPRTSPSRPNGRQRRSLLIVATALIWCKVQPN